MGSLVNLQELRDLLLWERFRGVIVGLNAGVALICFAIAMFLLTGGNITGIAPLLLLTAFFSLIGGVGLYYLFYNRGRDF